VVVTQRCTLDNGGVALPKTMRPGAAKTAGRVVNVRDRSAVCPHQQPQQTGMLFIIRQQVQPDFIIEVIHAQQASIIAQQDGSPLVQVMQTPSSVGSHLHRAIVKL
jgi:hypothetical protein